MSARRRTNVGAKAPESRSDARERVVRADAAALEHVRAQRASGVPVSRGCLYVVGAETYELYAVRRHTVVFRSTRNPNAFILSECSGPPDLARFVLPKR